MTTRTSTRKPRHALAAGLLLACALATGTAHAAPLFTPRNQPTGWVGELEVTGYNFSSENEVMFKPDFIKANWTGNLYAFPVDSSGTIIFDAEMWSGGAAPMLDARNFNDRIIFTMKKDGSKIPFRWLSLDSGQRSDMGGKEQRLNYVRGDRSNENPLGEKYAVRKSVMGDIIHSRPLYVPHPTDPLVIVGGNAALLHAFSATTGEEVWAYAPSMLFKTIPDLTADPYVHQYYVDGTPNAQKVVIGGATKTILVGGLGAGGKGLFALDITDPTAASEAAAANKLLWEITNSTINNAGSTVYEDLGFTYGVPLIVKLNNGNWAAIAANGYNNDKSNQAVLYVIDLMTGAKIAGITATVSGTSDGNPNGLSSPTAVDTNKDGMIDFVYAGDINGNLWKFNLSSATPASWSVTKLMTTSPAQPITGRPSVSLHSNGGYMVNFGTGRMFVSADVTDTTAYHAYGVWDNGFAIDTAKLVTQTLTEKTHTGGGFTSRVRVSSSNAVDYTAGAGQKHGWKLVLPAGERIVGDGGFAANMRYFFSAYNPTIVNPPVDGAAQPQGANWLHEVDFSTGGGFTAPIFDLDQSMALDDGDRVPNAGGTLTGPGSTPVARYMGVGVISQPIEAQLLSLSQAYFNTNPDYTVSITSSTGDPGVSGGHFDFDIYYSRRTHVHQYDDKYNVTGVNMLAPSLAAFNLANPIPSTATKFKILLANQKLSPAAAFHVGGNPAVKVTDYLTGTWPGVAALPTYARSTTAIAGALPLTSLMIALPLDAFASKVWVTGDITRAGLIPSQTGCVQSNRYGATGGPWYNGALFVTVIKNTTPDSAIQLNMPGDPSMGYRLKADATSQSYRLADYTMFWHHKNGKCHGDAGWIPNPPQDWSGDGGRGSTPAPGAADPKDGQFGVGGGVGSGGGTGGGTTNPNSQTVTYTQIDGTTVTQTTTRNADGSYTVTRVYSNGRITSFTVPPIAGGLESDIRAKTGRVSWREMVRP